MPGCAAVAEAHGERPLSARDPIVLRSDFVEAIQHFAAHPQYCNTQREDQKGGHFSIPPGSRSKLRGGFSVYEFSIELTDVSRLSSDSHCSASVTQPKAFFSRVFSCDSIRSTSSARARVLESGYGMTDSLKSLARGVAISIPTIP